MEETQKGKFWALLVGVNHYDYPQFNKLKYCVNDVKALEKTLTEFGYEVSSLHDELDDEHSPTYSNVKKKLSLFDKRLQPNDLLWVHFSCHGEWASQIENTFLILKDTCYTLLNNESKVLSVPQVERYMKNSGASKLILTLDACQSGVNIGRNVSDPPEFFYNVHEKAEGFVVLSATTANQKAYEYDDENKGIFTYFLLQGLNSPEVRKYKNCITVYQLYTHVLDESIKLASKNNWVQISTQRLETVGDIILAYYQENLVDIPSPLVEPVNLQLPNNSLNQHNDTVVGVNNNRRGVGVFSNRRDVEDGLHELRDSGFPMDRVSVIAQNPDNNDDIAGTEVQERVGNKADEGATVGALSGGTLGGLTGLLLGLGAIAIPGIGPIMLAGSVATALATTLAGAGIGAVAGSLAGGLIGLGIPEEQARAYNERVERGHYLVAVDGTDSEIARAETILKRRGIEDFAVYDQPKKPVIS